MRNYKEEFESRVAFIRDLLKKSGARGIVYGNSGGKDCTLVGILCKAACENTVGVVMPCHSKRNYGEDRDDALTAAAQYGIETKEVDLTAAREAMVAAVSQSETPSDAALSNIAPRLRMTVLYTIAQSRGALVAGTGNRSETFVGYFTKWGDGASDFNPISDLTVGEVYEFLDYLKAPENIRKKAPSAGLFEGQTDEKELGVSYAAIDRYILSGEGSPEEKERIAAMHARSAHKRAPIARYKEV